MNQRGTAKLGSDYAEAIIVQYSLAWYGNINFKGNLTLQAWLTKIIMIGQPL